jgi:hypothetical protein
MSQMGEAGAAGLKYLLDHHQSVKCKSTDTYISRLACTATSSKDKWIYWPNHSMETGLSNKGKSAASFFCQMAALVPAMF